MNRHERRRHASETRRQMLKTVSFQALDEVIRRHNLLPDENGNINFGEDIFAEAIALDEARGVKPDPKYADLDWSSPAAIEAAGFEEVDLDDLVRELHCEGRHKNN